MVYAYNAESRKQRTRKHSRVFEAIRKQPKRKKWSEYGPKMREPLWARTDHDLAETEAAVAVRL